MQKIQRGEVTKYAFDNRDEPVLRVPVAAVKSFRWRPRMRSRA